jgi:hypothetical protein
MDDSSYDETTTITGSSLTSNAAYLTLDDGTLVTTKVLNYV